MIFFFIKKVPSDFGIEQYAHKSKIYQTEWKGLHET